MSKYFPTPDEYGRHTIFPGVTIGTCSCEKMMLSVVDLAPHSVVEEHQHPHEQVGMLLADRAGPDLARPGRRCFSARRGRVGTVSERRAGHRVLSRRQASSG